MEFAPQEDGADNFIGPWGTLNFHQPPGVGLSQMGGLKFLTFLGGDNRIFSTGWNGGVSTPLAKNSLIPSPPGKALPVDSPLTKGSFHLH